MPQFTPVTLSRLLRNVDRETLKEAIELADLWDLFNTFERETIVEIGQIFNFFSNLEQSFPVLEIKSISEYLEEIQERLKDENIFLRVGAKVLFEVFAELFGLAELIQDEAIEENPIALDILLELQAQLGQMLDAAINTLVLAPNPRSEPERRLFKFLQFVLPRLQRVFDQLSQLIRVLPGA